MNAQIKYDDGTTKISGYGGNAEALVKCVHDKIFNDHSNADSIESVSGSAGEIKNVRGTWYTTDEEIKDAAIALGFWVIPEPHSEIGVGKFLNLFDSDAWEICFTWTQDPTRAPHKDAIHG